MKLFLTLTLALVTLTNWSFGQTIIKQQDAAPLLVTTSSSANKTPSLNFGVTQTSNSSLTSAVVIKSKTVSANNVFYLSYLDLGAVIQNVTVTTASDLGYFGLESPAGTVLIKKRVTAYQGQAPSLHMEFAEPLPIPAGQLIRAVAYPTSTATVEWSADFGGYER